MKTPPTNGSAVFSPDRRHRFRLDRRWGMEVGRSILWVMLNPSTADEQENDATLRRVIRFSNAWDFYRLTVVNLYSLVTTNPGYLYRAEDPVGGEENDASIALAAQEAGTIVLAWGACVPHPARIETVLGILRANYWNNGGLFCLGRTKSGQPRHPVRLANATKLEPFYG